ncbi:MAG: TIM barrel protein [Bacillota bacterium]|jgi:deoxyribonuclease-4|nr:TIM barrel protein [Clostridia bacterium]
MIRFGPAGNSDSFYAEGRKTTLDVPRWLHERGLNAYEYQCTRGVRITQAFANALRVQAERFHIALSIHAPYYINLASPDPTIMESSKKHILKSLQAARWMGADRVVMHPGSVSKLQRNEAMKNALILLEKIVTEIDPEILDECCLCPETMGKVNNLGTLPEILELCKIHPRIIPTVDFGHIHALEGGSLKGEAQFQRVIEKIEKVLGSDVVKNLHVHFSPVEFTAGGERKHHNLMDKEYGPEFLPFAKIIRKHGLAPRVICESAGCQAEDAAAFKSIYLSLKNDSPYHSPVV